MTEQATDRIDVDTKVNPFTGISDPDKTAEIAEKLYQAGAFNPDGKPDAEQNGAVEGSEREAPTEESRPAWHDSYEAMEQAERHAEHGRSQKAVQIQQAMQAGQQAAQNLAASFRTVNWERLKVEDPQAYQALIADYTSKEQQIAAHMQNLHAHAQGLASEYLAVEREKAMRLIPEWRDPKAFQAAKADMLEYARKYGIPQADIESITDARHLVALFHASQVGKAPAPKGPGVRVNKVKKADPPPALKSLLGARERFMDNPNDFDAQSAYAQRLIDMGA
jgi:hypothetical protein